MRPSGGMSAATDGLTDDARMDLSKRRSRATPANWAVGGKTESRNPEMIHVSETFALSTVEDFLTEEDVEQLNKIMDAEPGTQRAGSLSAHITAPDAAQYVLQQAVERALPAIRSTMPSVAAAGAWDYAELAPGDYVHVHLDGIPAPAVPPRRIGRMGVTIRKADEGGLFYVATSSSPGLWTGEELGEAEGYSAGTKLTRQLEGGRDQHAAPLSADLGGEPAQDTVDDR